MLARLIDRKFASRRAFARAAEPDNGVATASLISNVILGKNYPPFPRVERWADALGLDGNERQEFLDLAACAHLPDEVRPQFERMAKQHRELLRKH